MLLPERRPNGRILVAARAEGPDGVIGDGARDIGPDDPRYEAALREIEARERYGTFEDWLKANGLNLMP